MPLLIIGLFLLIGILIYAIYVYRHSNEDSQKSPGRRLREEQTRQKDDPEEPDGPSSRILYFPSDNVEVEKRKRS